MIITRRRASKIVIGSAAVLASGAALARAPEIYLSEGGIFGSPWTHAANGFDVVAFHGLAANDDPVPGDPAFSAAHKGANWLFANQENLDAFVAAPEKFAPQYGGYCAWAVARNKLAKGDPAAWHVHNDKLYLNVNKRIRSQFLANIERDISNADKNWPAVLDTK